MDTSQDERERFYSAFQEAAESVGSEYLLADLQALALESEAGRQAWTDWRLKDQTELDLHLTGGSIEDHSDRAERLGQFMKRSAEAVKEIAKGIGGLQRHAPGLQVLAPTAGSVRVVFLSSRHRPTGDAETITGTESETLDSLALHRLASLLAQASDEDRTLLQGSVEELPGKARNAVRLLASTIADSAWTMEGTIAARGHGEQPVFFTAEAAVRLRDAAALESVEIDEVRLDGEIDGWIWSKSVLRFLPSGGRPFQATVPPDLQEKVARINGDPAHLAHAVFRVTTQYAPGDSNFATRSYVLKKVYPVEAPPSLEDLVRDDTES